MVVWETLLSDKRLGQVSSSSCHTRSNFQKDTDRIVFSSYFRRLQDKTQVQPFAYSDYIRRRLTHSLEVSSVARSLGADAGKYLSQKYPNLNNAVFAEQITASAALVHDIGNPPFGHVGEKAIQDWFCLHNDNPLLEQLEKNQRKDFQKFEGNAQGFRILTRLANNGNGLALTAATLGAFMKYPTASWATSSAGYVGQKKHGFFVDDQQFFSELCSELALPKIDNGAFARHPFAFLVEAADDICYRIIDLEDGWKAGRISFSDAEECLVGLLSQTGSYNPKQYSDEENIGWLRAKSIDSLTQAVMVAFKDHITELEAGRLPTSLIEKTQFHHGIKQAKTLAVENVFKWDRVQLAELAGINMISELLDDFINALERPDTAKGQHVISLLPNYNKDAAPYFKLLAVTDYISGMTDSFLSSIRSRITAGAFS